MRKFSRVFFIFFTFLLVSCSTSKKEKDIDNIKIPNTEIVTAIKKKEYNLDPRFSNDINTDDFLKG